LRGIGVIQISGAFRKGKSKVMWFLWPLVAPRMMSFPALWSIASPTTFMSVEAPGWDYTPITEWGEGNLNVERRIRNAVATPGRELGIINDALIGVLHALENTNALENLSDRDTKSIIRFRNMVDMIDVIVEEERAKSPRVLREIPPATG
jgi:hypothetical protein